jgi:DNA mismatch endonuclease (patch repair protein)
MDRISKERRSWNMSRISGVDTAPERFVRSLLHGMGFRFRLHDKALPGKPDIVLKKHRTLIFVHGCFWHRHEACRYCYSPKSNIEFWQAKFKRNVSRDTEVKQALRKLGWHVLTVWECEVANEKKLRRKLMGHLTRNAVS